MITGLGLIHLREKKTRTVVYRRITRLIIERVFAADVTFWMIILFSFPFLVTRSFLFDGRKGRLFSIVLVHTMGKRRRREYSSSSNIRLCVCVN